MEQRQIGDATEIWEGSGKYWITENYPTNFHTFFRRKMLVPEDTIENYRRCDNSEMSQLSLAARRWQEPPQAFINMWNTRLKRCKGNIGESGYDNTSGYFMLNGIIDLTYEDARRIYACPQVSVDTPNTGIYSGYYETMGSLSPRLSVGGGSASTGGMTKQIAVGPRTNFPDETWLNITPDFNKSCMGNTKMEVAVLHGVAGAGCFDGCKSLHTIWVDAIGEEDPGLGGLSALRELYVGSSSALALKGNLDIRSAANISLATMQRAVNKQFVQGGDTITIMVHDDVFAKLRGDTTNEAAAALSPDELAEWVAVKEKSEQVGVLFTAVITLPSGPSLLE